MPVSLKFSPSGFGHGCWNMQVHFLKLNILFHFTYQDEYTVNILHTSCFPYFSYLGTDEENLFNITDICFLSDHVLLFLEPLIYV